MQRLTGPAALPDTGTNVLMTSRSGVSLGGRPLTSVASLSSGGSYRDTATSLPWDNGSPMPRKTNGGRQQASIDASEVSSASDLQPCDDPGAELQRVITVLNASNAASRLELDWQAQLQVRLADLLTACALSAEVMGTSVSQQLMAFACPQKGGPAAPTCRQ